MINLKEIRGTKVRGCCVMLALLSLCLNTSYGARRKLEFVKIEYKWGGVLERCNNDSLYPICVFASEIDEEGLNLCHYFSNINHFGEIDDALVFRDYFEVNGKVFYLDDVTGRVGKYDAGLDIASAWLLKTDSFQYCLLKAEISGLSGRNHYLSFVIKFNKEGASMRSFYSDYDSVYSKPELFLNERRIFLVNWYDGKKKNELL